MPLPKVIASIAALAACSVCWTAAAQDRVPVDRGSPFLKELYGRPVPAEYRDLLLASAILTVTGNEDDGMMLRRFAKRKALKTFLGEPFAFSGTTQAAIALENGMTPAAIALQLGTTHPATVLDEGGNDTYAELRNRALASVTVVPAADGTIRVNNGLKEDVREVAVAIPGGKADSQSVRLGCKPATGPAFAPNVSLAAAQCTGEEALIGAFRAAAGSKPVAAHTLVVATENTVIAPNYMRFGGEPVPLTKEALRLVASIDCAQLDSCVNAARAGGEGERMPLLLAGLVLGVIAIAWFVRRMKSRKPRA